MQTRAGRAAGRRRGRRARGAVRARLARGERDEQHARRGDDAPRPRTARARSPRAARARARARRRHARSRRTHPARPASRSSRARSRCRRRTRRPCRPRRRGASRSRTTPPASRAPPPTRARRRQPAPPTSRGPKRSQSRPAGTCNAACVTKSAVVKRPTTAEPDPVGVRDAVGDGADVRDVETGRERERERRRARALIVQPRGLAAPVRARLLPVAAELHRAPGRRSVRRVVVERPVAVATRLQPLPGPVEHRREGDRDDPVERVAVGADGQARPSADSSSDSRAAASFTTPSGGRVEREAVVGEHERPQRLAQLARPVELGAERRAPRASPAASRCRSRRSTLLMNCCTCAQRLGRGLRDVVARAHGCPAF